MTGSIWWLVLAAVIFVGGFGIVGWFFARVDRPERRSPEIMKGDRTQDDGRP